MLDRLSYATFGLRLKGKAGFEIFQKTGIFVQFEQDKLPKLLQIPRGIEIQESTDLLSVVRFYSNRDPIDYYIFFMLYKSAGLDINNRRTYYAGAVGYKFLNAHPDPEELLQFLENLTLNAKESIENHTNKLVENVSPITFQNYEINYEASDNNKHGFISIPSQSLYHKKNLLILIYSNELAHFHRLSASALGQKINPSYVEHIKIDFSKLPIQPISHKKSRPKKHNTIAIECENCKGLQAQVDELKKILASKSSREKNEMEKQVTSNKPFSLRNFFKNLSDAPNWIIIPFILFIAINLLTQLSILFIQNISSDKPIETDATNILPPASSKTPSISPYEKTIDTNYYYPIRKSSLDTSQLLLTQYYYVVKSNDDIAKITQQHNITEADLLQLNPKIGKKPYLIKGDKLIIQRQTKIPNITNTR